MSIILRTFKISIFKNATAKKFILIGIGEIFLVMFGILLALEVDNWKENRKSLSIERMALKGIYDDLHQNRNKIQYIIKNDSMRIIGNQKLIALLKDPLSDYHQDYDTLLGKILQYDAFFCQRTSYESLDNSSTVIKNNPLRGQITHLFDYILKELEQQGNRSKELLIILSEPVITRHLETGQNLSSRFPNDFQALKKDQEFLNHLTAATAQQRLFVEYFKMSLKEIDWVIAAIEKELSFEKM